MHSHRDQTTAGTPCRGPLADDGAQASSVGTSRQGTARSGRTSGVQRALGLAAACAIALAGLTALAVPAQAQTEITLVSTIGQDNAGDTGQFTNDHAQAFTTGSDTAGYTLTGVDIHLFIAGAQRAGLTVTINNDSSGSPGTSLGTLTNPASAPLITGVYSWTTTGIDLAASTTYFVVIDSTQSSNDGVRQTDSDDEDSGNAAGWSVGDSSLFRSRTSTGGWTTWAQTKEIRIKGFAKGSGTDTTAPTVTITGVPATSTAPFTATFTFSEAVTGFVVGDITVGNGTASSFTATSTSVYTALITPTATGAVTVDIAANVATDGAGNGNTAATRASSDYTAPDTTSTGDGNAPSRVRLITDTGVEITGDMSARLVWDPPKDPGSQTLAKYQYRYASGTSISGNPAWTDVAGQGGLRYLWLHNLHNSSQYTFEVRAVYGSGSGTAGNASRITVTTGTPKTQVETIWPARVNSDSSILLFWSAIEKVGNEAITGYRVDESTNCSSWTNLTTVTQVPPQTAVPTTYTRTGLSRGNVRCYRVRAESATKQSAWSAPVRGNTRPLAPGAPQPVITAVPNATDPNYYIVSWAAVESHGYNVTYYGNGISDAGIRPRADGQYYFILRTSSTTAPRARVLARINDSKRVRGKVLGRHVDTWSGNATVGSMAFDPFAGVMRNTPTRHDGRSTFSFELYFNQDPGPIARGTMRDSLLQITGGRVADARRSSTGDHQTWTIDVTPTQSGPITVRLPARECDEPGAVCAGEEPLIEPTTVTVPGPEFTGSFHGAPSGHDAVNSFQVRFELSEAPGGMSWRTVRDHLFTVQGGSIDKARRTGTVRNQAWELTLKPSGPEDMTLTTRATASCDDAHAVCTADGRALAGGTTLAVPGPAGLIGTFSGAPADHDGTRSVELRFELSEQPEGLSSRTVQDHLFDVTGARIERARRTGNVHNKAWLLTISPEGDGDFTLTTRATAACTDAHAVCTSEGAKLQGGASVTVKGPAAVSVADAEAVEAHGATLDFTVTLTRARSTETSVNYRTFDGTAHAGADYNETRGLVLFEAGETEKTIRVPVLEDAHDEGDETMKLTLTSARGASIERAEATGTITNSDPMPLAWMVRFGRTVGSQVVDALTARLDGASGSHITVAGISLLGEAEPEPEAKLDDPFALPKWAQASRLEPDAETITGKDLLLRSGFHLSSGGDGAHARPAFTAWGNVSTGGFEAEEDDVAMDGDVTTGLVGFDAEWDRLLAGVLLSQSSGDGTYRLSENKGGDGGTVKSDLTGVYPYARVDLNARVSAWALAGTGTGSITLHQENVKSMKTDLSMRIGAVGVKGALMEPSEASGLALNLKSDAMWVGTKSERTRDMVATEGDVTRFRLILQGERVFASESGRTFVPSAEVGLRHDGGDAETGTGLEVGAGLQYTAGALSIEGRVRTLVAHEASGYREWGASGAIRVNPSQSGRGLTLSIAPEWGRTGSATEQLWGAGDARALSPEGADFEPSGRLAMDAGYGLGLGYGRGVLTPYAGMTFGEASSRTMRGGAKWQLGPDVAVGVEATREDTGETSSTGIQLRAALRF